jgi:chloramphenicol 3-O phosphotransferase
MGTKPGTIILLNGSPSAGKTSLAKAVQEAFAEPYFHLGIDTFVGHVGTQRHRTMGTHAAEGVSLIPIPGTDPPETEFRIGPAGEALISAMHHAIGAVARAGHGVVVDYHVMKPAWMDEWVAVWADLPVLLVHVSCPLAVVEERSATRGDRPALAKGAPRWFLLRGGLLHCPYDLTIDTSQVDPATGALQIKRYLDSGVALWTASHESARIWSISPSPVRQILDTGGRPIRYFLSISRVTHRSV